MSRVSGNTSSCLSSNSGCDCAGKVGVIAQSGRNLVQSVESTGSGIDQIGDRSVGVSIGSSSNAISVGVCRSQSGSVTCSNGSCSCRVGFQCVETTGQSGVSGIASGLISIHVCLNSTEGSCQRLVDSVDSSLSCGISFENIETTTQSGVSGVRSKLVGIHVCLHSSNSSSCGGVRLESVEAENSSVNRSLQSSFVEIVFAVCFQLMPHATVGIEHRSVCMTVNHTSVVVSSGGESGLVSEQPHVRGDLLIDVSLNSSSAACFSVGLQFLDGGLHRGVVSDDSTCESAHVGFALGNTQTFTQTASSLTDCFE